MIEEKIKQLDPEFYKPILKSALGDGVFLEFKEASYSGVTVYLIIGDKDKYCKHFFIDQMTTAGLNRAVESLITATKKDMIELGIRSLL